ncbi:MAG: hypothetical protein J5725_07175 [Bacteroidales bacterium]|nr:hypothetical protein [Bacteroidales bacterium]
MQKEEMENRTYEFIGRLALVLFSQNIKMSFDTLASLLKDNGLDDYAGGRGMAAGVSAAYRRWEEKEKDCRIPATCGAIANTFVNSKGELSWLEY